MRAVAELLKRLNGFTRTLLTGGVLFFFYLPTNIIYFFADRMNDAQHLFLGGALFPDDHDSYLAFIAQAARGAWLFVNPYDVADHAAAYFNPLWLLMGLTGASFGLLRLVALLVLETACDAFFRRLRPHAGLMERAAALSLFLFAGGLGWTAAGNPGVLATLPPDTHTELFPFVQAAFLPHAALSHGLLIAALALLIGPRRRPYL